VSPDSARFGFDWYSEDVIDIGGSQMSGSLRSELDQKLLWKQGQFQAHRLLPASIIHDEKGLKMWRAITRLPDYYQTRDEIQLLRQNGRELAKAMEGRTNLIDLGCGYVYMLSIIGFYIVD